MFEISAQKPYEWIDFDYDKNFCFAILKTSVHFSLLSKKFVWTVLPTRRAKVREFVHSKDKMGGFFFEWKNLKNWKHYNQMIIQHASIYDHDPFFLAKRSIQGLEPSTSETAMHLAQKKFLNK